MKFGNKSIHAGVLDIGVRFEGMQLCSYIYFDASIGRCIESYVRLNVFWSVNDASMQID